jgi:hypothetical protein
VSDLFQMGRLEEAVAALRRDLLAEDGPQITTMRNYRFAILPYLPREEFRLRKHIAKLSDELRANDWAVLPIALQKVLLDRLRATGSEAVQSIIDRERRLHAKSPDRALTYLRDTLAQHIEGPEGLAADVSRLINQFIEAHPNHKERTVAIIGRAGALYPFFRTSALLKHLDGHTRSVPCILLYPGERRDVTALSFMGELPEDRDYRPRIYP